MHPELRNLIPAIEKRLSQEDIEFFKIGKSESAEERFKDPEYNDCQLMGIVAAGCPQIIDQAERDLIKYFKSSNPQKLCENENQGGGGNPMAIELYIFAKQQEADRFDGLLDPSPLFEFKPVQLK